MNNMINVNEFIRRITLREGKKKSLPIGQVREVVHEFAVEFNTLSYEDQQELIARLIEKDND